MFDWFWYKIGAKSEPHTGVYWDCADCGCLMFSETDTDEIFCGGCKNGDHDETEHDNS